MLRAVSRGPGHRGHGPRRRGRDRRGRSTPAPTTTWSSRSAPPSSTPGSGRCCAAARRDRARRGRRGRRAADRPARPAGRSTARPLELTPARVRPAALPRGPRPGSVVTKRELLTEVWQQPYGGADKTVDVHLSWLRRKLGETAQQPRYLHTVRGVGVRIAAPAPPWHARGRSVPAHRGLTGAPAGCSAVAATMSLVLVAFLVPLALLVRMVAAERAVLRRERGPRQLTAQVAARDPAALRRGGHAARRERRRPVTVFRADGRRARLAGPRTPRCQLAARGAASTGIVAGGREISGRGARPRPGVPRWSGPSSAMRSCPTGVARAWLILAGLGRRAARARRGRRRPAGAQPVARPIDGLAVSHRLAERGSRGPGRPGRARPRSRGWPAA